MANPSPNETRPPSYPGEVESTYGTTRPLQTGQTSGVSIGLIIVIALLILGALFYAFGVGGPSTFTPVPAPQTTTESAPPSTSETPPVVPSDPVDPAPTEPPPVTPAPAPPTPPAAPAAPAN